MNNQTYALVASGVRKVFGSDVEALQVLNGIDLEVLRGEKVAIVGASGSGKSTLLHILGGLDEATAGNIELGGVRFSDIDEVSRNQLRNQQLGFIYQFHHLLPEFTALENVMMPGLIAGMGGKTLETAAKDLLAQVGLSHRAKHRPSELSGGESQRVALARALVMRPEMILADEPTGNLDNKNAENLYELFVELKAVWQQRIIMVTHNEKLTSHSDQVIYLNSGRIE
jgi:lipoprotein-releasing system ATP-binding protein